MILFVYRTLKGSRKIKLRRTSQVLEDQRKILLCYFYLFFAKTAFWQIRLDFFEKEPDCVRNNYSA